MFLKIRSAVLYIMLVAGAMVSMFPFYWMFIMGTHPNSAVNHIPPVLLPSNLFLHNFRNAMRGINFLGALGNTVIVSVSVTVGMLFFCSLAGYAFAKFKFPLKNVLFMLLLVTMMVPHQLNLIPSYIVIINLHLLDSLIALILPGLVSAFGIFWMRQYIESAIPDELMEAGYIDGCRNFRIYWNLVVPIILPAFATLGIVTFLATWNDFLWPLVVLKSQENFTLQVALQSLFSQPHDRDYGKIMVATFVATLPLLCVFLIMRRYFMNGLTAGAIKI